MKSIIIDKIILYFSPPHTLDTCHVALSSCWLDDGSRSSRAATGPPRTRRGRGRGTGHTGTAGLLDAWTRLLLTKTQSGEVENCIPAHGLGLVRRRGEAQAAAIASRYISLYHVTLP